MNIEQLLAFARSRGASDLHISHGSAPSVRVRGEIQFLRSEPGFDPDSAIREFLTPALLIRLNGGSDLDFAFTDSSGLRCRANVYRNQGGIAAAFRLLADKVPTLQELMLPPILAKLALEPRGLVLVTGPTGSGKSTTLAAMIDFINSNRRCHILTLEDPIEYVHANRSSLVNQRELGTDIQSFSGALRSALREDPDVILVGEMRDAETISAALTAAETGHLVLSTLHTTGAVRTIDRIIDGYPGKEKTVCSQLAGTLRGVVSQILVNRADGSGRMAVCEIMLGTDAIANLIRENKSYQIPSAMQTGALVGMQLLDNELARLCRAGVITREDALSKAYNPTSLISSL